MKLLRRAIEKQVRQALKTFPAIYISGARQTGKSTFVKEITNGRFSYVSLDNIDVLTSASRDPQRFIQQQKKPVIIDEIQRIPELTLAIKNEIDNNKIPGQFILTGSARLEAVKGIKDTLAGRVAIYTLHPFTILELNSAPFNNPVDEIFEIRTQNGLLDLVEARKSITLDTEIFINGGYPDPSYVFEQEEQRTQWFRQYRGTYIQRDIRDILSIQDVPSFARFVEIIASSSSCIVSYSDLSRDAGMSADTAKRWINLLELTFITARLYPFWSNIRKRLVKSPKLYFNDSGLLSSILGFDTETAAVNREVLGQIFETWVFNQLSALVDYSNKQTAIYFYRSHEGEEIDFVLERKGKFIPVEVKFSDSISQSDLKSLYSVIESGILDCEYGIVIYLGKDIRTLGRIIAVPASKMFGS